MAISIGPKIGIDGEAAYRKQLQNIIQSTKTLDSEMKKVKSSFDKNTSAQEKAEKQTEVLEKKQAALRDAVEKMTEQQERAIEKYGESSTEAQKWTEKLNNAEAALNECNAEIANQQEELLNAHNSMEELTNSIEYQQGQLESLASEYENAVSAYGENSEEAQNLSSQIETLTSSIDENQQKLSEMSSASADASSGMDDLADGVDGATEATEGLGAASGIMNTGFTSAIGGMVQSFMQGDVAGLVGGLVETIMDVSEASIEMENKWQEAQATIQQGTGLIGEELEAMTERAKEAWSTIAQGDGADSAIETTAMLATRFGNAAAEQTNLSETVMAFQNECGAGAVDTVNNLADSMKLWGQYTGEAATDAERASVILDEVRTATQLADVSAEEIFSTLKDNASVFGEMGLSMEEAINMMVNYRDAGGKVSDLNSTLTTVMKKANAAGNDFATAWTEITTIMSTNMDAQTKLQHDVEATGTTLEKSIGVGKAKTIVAAWDSMKKSSIDFGQACKDNVTVLEQYDMNLTNEEATETFNKKLESMTGISSESYGKIEKLGCLVGINFPAMAQAYGKAVDSEMIEKTKGVPTETGKALQETESQFESTIQNISNKLATTSFPALKVSIDVPDISVDAKGKVTNNGTLHFAKAMNNAYIVGNPTMFMAGDSGPEVVVGESHLYSNILKAVQTAGGGGTVYNINGISVAGSGVEDAIETIVRAARISRRA